MIESIKELIILGKKRYFNKENRLDVIETYLTPLNQVQIYDDRWHSIGNDPQFAILPRNSSWEEQPLGRWIAFTFKVEVSGHLSCRLYLDLGEGVSEDFSIPFSLRTGTHIVPVFLPVECCIVRLDPCENEKVFVLEIIKTEWKDFPYITNTQFESSLPIYEKKGIFSGNFHDLDAVNELNYLGHNYTWESTGRDPWFNCCEDKIPVSSGWYMLELKIYANCSSADAKFYFDFGDGFSEENSILLSYQSGKMVKRLVWLSSKPKNIRFDPMEDYAHFSIFHLNFARVYRPFALDKMKSRLLLKQNDFSDTLVANVALENNLSKVQALYKLYNNTFQKDNYRSEMKYRDWVQFIEPKKISNYQEMIADEDYLFCHDKQDMVVSLIYIVQGNAIDSKLLSRSLSSVATQSNANWQLNIVISDDINYGATKEQIDNFVLQYADRTVLTECSASLQLAERKNLALLKCIGDYVGLLYSSDELHSCLVEFILSEISLNEHLPVLVYTDNDKVDMAGNRMLPNFKPDYAHDLLMNDNYFDSFVAINRDVLIGLDGWDIRYLDGVDNYDLSLKVVEQGTNIMHLPYILYHTNKDMNITREMVATKEELNQQFTIAIEQAGLRRQTECHVITDARYQTRRVSYILKGEPLVSIVIPFKDKPELLVMCLDAILKLSTYKNFEVIGVSNNSEEQETFDVMASYESRDSRIKFIEHNVPFNYSEINNYAVNNYANGKHIILLNNDIEILSPSWIEAMLEFSQRDDVGCVGSKLYYPDDTIQHAGIVVGIARTAGHSHRHVAGHSSGYQNKLNLVQNFSGVTAACLMVKRSVFDEVQGLNENELKVAFNDVDFCLRVREKGYWNVYTPYCEAYHYESISRGHEDTPEKIKRFKEESGYLRDRHKAYYRDGDPFYNVNLTLNGEDFTLASTSKEMNPKFMPQPFVESIIVEVVNDENVKHNKLCIFSHYDKDGMIDPYVEYYLQCLSKHFDIIFVSTATGITHEECLKVLPYCIRVIAKENYGYDFGAYKSGLGRVQDKINDFASYDWLLLCNDSIYAPFDEFEGLIQAMESGEHDVIAMSDNHEVAHHLQSYFVAYNREAYQHRFFQKFWDNFVIYEDKDMLIEQCEIGFSNKLIEQSNLRIYSLAKRHDGTYANQLHFYWKELIDSGFPAIKIQLLRDNPMNVDIDGWENTIVEASDYPVELIVNHLKRFK